MNATGQVFIINPSGILFGKTSQVNVGGIVATTHQLSDSDYLAGRTLFSRSGSSAAVINEGNITTAIAGYAALLAPEVRNDGVILARQGTVALASGEGIALQFEGSNLIRCLQADMTINEFSPCCTQGAGILDNAGCQLPNRLRTENN